MISVAIPTHQDRVKYFIHNIKRLYDVVDEFVVIDDASGPIIDRRIREAISGMKKVRYYQNESKRGVFLNKYYTVLMCNHEWVAMLDSDNDFGIRYIEAFKNALEAMKGNTIYCPVKALPNFDFSKYSGKIIINGNAGYFMEDGMFQVLMNTGNYVVNRKKYLEILRPCSLSEYIPQCCDVIYSNYHILKAGGTMCVVPGMKYRHLDHPGSTYRQNVEKEPNETLKWQNMVRTLK